MQLSARVYICTSISFFLLFLLSVVGFASPAWRAGNYGKQQYLESGLIIRCHHDLSVTYHRCAPFMMGSQPPWFETSRILSAISVVLLFTLVIASVFLHINDTKRKDYMYLLIGAIVTAVIGTTGAIVFAAMSTDLLNYYNADLSWSWALFLLSHLLLVVVAVIFIIIMQKVTRKPKPKPVAPAREIIF